MKQCAHCRKEIAVDKYFSRKATCPECGADLHICLNCRFYSETAHNNCTEPRAEFQRSRERANFCDFFSFREGPAGPASGSSSSSGPGKDAARKAFDDLFKK